MPLQVRALAIYIFFFPLSLFFCYLYRESYRDAAATEAAAVGGIGRKSQINPLVIPQYTPFTHYGFPLFAFMLQDYPFSPASTPSLSYSFFQTQNPLLTPLLCFSLFISISFSLLLSRLLLLSVNSENSTTCTSFLPAHYPNQDISFTTCYVK